MSTSTALFPPRRRSSSIFGHIKQTTQDESDQRAAPNPAASWMNNRGAWTVHFIGIFGLFLLFDSLPFVSAEWCWTLTNLTYVIFIHIMFHYVTGLPFDFNSGAYDNLTLWEQMDDGYQYTPSKKFLLCLPIALFLISTHFAHYHLYLFVINLGLCILSLVPKLPSSHRLRLMPEETPTPNQSLEHLPMDKVDLTR